MFPSSLILFRFAPGLIVSGLLDDNANNQRAQPCGALEMRSQGFLPVFGDAGGVLTHDVQGVTWLAVGGEAKILPAASVNAEVARRAVEIETKEGRRLGGRARKRLKEEVLHEMLPRALTRPVRTDVFVDNMLGVVAVATGSRRLAEDCISEIRQALGSFPALPVNAERAPRAVMTGWLSGDPMPGGLTLGDDCTLTDPSDVGARVRCTGQHLESDEIATHLHAGKQCSAIGVNLDDHLSFRIGDDLVIRSLRFLDGAVESLENTERESMRAELDARFALFVGEFRRMFGVLEQSFKLSGVE